MNKKFTSYKTQQFTNTVNTVEGERPRERYRRLATRYSANKHNYYSASQNINQNNENLQSKIQEITPIELNKNYEQNPIPQNNINLRGSDNTIQNEPRRRVNHLNKINRYYIQKAFLCPRNDNERRNVAPRNISNSKVVKNKSAIEIKNPINDDNNINNINNNKSLKEVMELPNENLGNEIKETVRCYICSQKITKPKMCPKCKHISCEKCLYNWFIKNQNKNCKFCKEPMDFYKMIPVPFMDTVIDFVEKVIEDNKIQDEDEDVKNNEINEINNKIENNNNINENDYCSTHPKELLHYYCTNCNKAYCKVCFVFFGKEKDKHIGHNIIEYKNYKPFNISDFDNEQKKLNDNIFRVETLINRCLSYKKVNDFQQKSINNFMDIFIKEYNKKMDTIQNQLDNKIKDLKKILENYQNNKNEMDNFIKNKNEIFDGIKGRNILNKLTKINGMKLFSGKEIEKEFNTTPDIFFNSYQTKISEINHENMFLCKPLKLENSKCELLIDNKAKNCVNVNLIVPKDRTLLKHWYKGFVVVRKKGDIAQIYELDDTKEVKEFFYLKKSIPWDKNGEQVFKVRAILLDCYFD